MNLLRPRYCCFFPPYQPKCHKTKLSIHGFLVTVYGKYFTRYGAVKVVEQADTSSHVTRKTGPFTWDVFFGNVVFENVYAYSEKQAIQTTRRVINSM
jgi:hypothetical protein